MRRKELTFMPEKVKKETAELIFEELEKFDMCDLDGNPAGISLTEKQLQKLKKRWIK